MEMSFIYQSSSLLIIMKKSMDSKITIGLFGLGTVGQGLYTLLESEQHNDIELIKIAVKNRHKKRAADRGLLTYDRNDILNNEQINTIVELIDDHEVALEIVQTALSKGKHVVTANKRMLAHHLPELIKLARENNVALLYEGSVCGSIPILRNIEEYYAHDQINEITGIFNGSSNYILSKMVDEKLTYASALHQAQENGFAESDPSMDVCGWDALFKTIILNIHAFGIHLNPNALIRSGIQHLKPEDIIFAQSRKLSIKPVSRLIKWTDHKLSAIVMPAMINQGHLLYTVSQENNAVVLDSDYTDKQLLMGKGAGSLPTGAAVYSDVLALRKQYTYQYRKFENVNGLALDYSSSLDIYISHPEKASDDLPLEKVYEQGQINNINFTIGKINLSALKNELVTWESEGYFVAVI